MTDLLAIGAYAAARDLGLEVGHDLSVIGYDGLPTGAFLDPPLTTLRQPAASMAAAVASLLVGDHSTNNGLLTQRFRAELVVGRSTGRPRTGG